MQSSLLDEFDDPVLELVLEYLCIGQLLEVKLLSRRMCRLIRNVTNLYEFFVILPFLGDMMGICVTTKKSTPMMTIHDHKKMAPSFFTTTSNTARHCRDDPIYGIDTSRSGEAECWYHCHNLKSIEFRRNRLMQPAVHEKNLIMMYHDVFTWIPYSFGGTDGWQELRGSHKYNTQYMRISEDGEGYICVRGCGMQNDGILVLLHVDGGPCYEVTVDSGWSMFRILRQYESLTDITLESFPEVRSGVITCKHFDQPDEEVYRGALYRVHDDSINGHYWPNGKMKIVVAKGVE